MSLLTVPEIIVKLKGKNELSAKLILTNWALDIISECASIADEWRSATPEFTKSYVETVKKNI